MNRVFAKVIGQMPPFYEIAYAVWGDGANFDSDGDSDTPDSTDWRELTLELRSARKPRIDVDPTPEDRDVVELRSESENLLNQVLVILEEHGSIVRLSSD